MAFLRLKTSRGRQYAYLVENHWVPTSGHSRQRVLRYLGRLDQLRVEALPAEHRTPPIVQALEEVARREANRLDAISERYRADFQQALLTGDSSRAGQIARAAVRNVGVGRFSTRVLAEVMHEVGRGWAEGRISVSQEHLATGVVVETLTALKALAARGRGPGREVVLCAPEGEAHTVALLLAENLLLERGYRPVNIGHSAPRRSIAEFVRARRPYGLLISVTQPGCLEEARALARHLHQELPELRLAMGGQALETLPPGYRLDGVEFVRSPMAEYLDSWPEDGQVGSPAEPAMRPIPPTAPTARRRGGGAARRTG